MKEVSEKEWREKAENFQARIAANPYPVNLDHYRSILSKVTVGKEVIDIGCGNCYVGDVLPFDVFYYPCDPFPRDVNNYSIHNISAERLNIYDGDKFDTVICLAALDNVQSVELALKGMLNVAKNNIVILTGIGVKVDHLHTHTIERKDLTDVLGEPTQEIEISPKVFLFEWRL